MKRPILVLLTASALALSHGTLNNTVLFDREIVRILDTHCVMCHAEKGPAFPLETYEQTWLKMKPIYSDVISRHMPPWPAVPGYGIFANDNGLTLRENQFIVSWVEGLGPRDSGTVFSNTAAGAGTAPADIRARTDFDHWKLGQPEVTRKLPASTIDAGLGNQVRRVTVDLGLTQERYLRAVEYMPGDRRVLRAAFFSIQETGQWIGSWTPWYGYFSVPNNGGIRLPAGSHILADIYYMSAKERVTDQGTLGLTFAKAPPAAQVFDTVLEAKGAVPAVASGQKFRAVAHLTAETHALALRTESMTGVKSIEVSARRADGGTEVLLFAKDFQPDWPTPYIFKEPVVLPAGTDLSVVSYVANPGASPQTVSVRVTLSAFRKAPQASAK